MLAQDKYQAVTNEIEEIQEVRKKVDDMRVKFEKIPKELDDLAKSLKSTAESEYKKDLAKEEKQ